MLLTFVIPTFNRARLLRKTLPALLSQLVEPWFDYEVIFVSNGSSDETDELLRAAEAENPGRLRYFHILPTGGPSAPRNRGIHEARGQVVIIQDDDVLPDWTMVLEHARFHRQYPEQQHAALGEVYVPAQLLHDPMTLFHSFPYDEVRGIEKLSYLHFWTCNVSLKRDFMLQNGMFDEAFLFYEDVICAHRLQANGLHLHFLPTARGAHLHELKAADVAAKGLFYGKWLSKFFDAYPQPEVMQRFEIVSRRCGNRLYASSLLRRIRFRVLDNPLTALLLRLGGANKGSRSRLSDLYYSYILRRNIFAGYQLQQHQSRRSST